MEISKTGKISDGDVGERRVKSPGTPWIHVDGKGKLAVHTHVWVPGPTGQAEQLQVVLTDGDIERLLSSLAEPQDPAIAAVVANTMRQNLRSLLRMTALGSGVALSD